MSPRRRGRLAPGRTSEQDLQELGIELGPEHAVATLDALGETPLDERRLSALREAVQRRLELRARGPRK